MSLEHGFIRRQVEVISQTGAHTYKKNTCFGELPSPENDSEPISKAT